VSERPRRVAGLRIVDAVFERGRVHASWRFAAAPAAALVVHALVLTWAIVNGARRLPPPAAPEPVVELVAAPPPPAPPPPAPPPPAPRRAEARTPRTHAPAAPPPPAQAGKIVAQEPDPRDPVDLGDRGFVTGTGQTYAGGATTTTGTNTHAVESREVDPRSTDTTPDHSSSVGLVDDDWSCPWPHEADDREIDEQIVVLRIVVRPDGTVESARAVTDPGFGFGEAAVACAERTRFLPARGRDGNAIRAGSPPIRVRFTR
jgi:protein TonB